MSKYFLDTEFLEGTQVPSFFLKNRVGKLIGAYQKPTIDLISIGIISEDGREYYAISKDFNLKEAWNRYDIIKGDSTMVKSIGDNQYEVKNYWLRDNVLTPIFWDLFTRKYPANITSEVTELNYKVCRELLKEYGKTNKEIAEEVKEFCKYQLNYPNPFGSTSTVTKIDTNLEFYTYYGAYDWVVFCWLFGKMIDLPKGFPMFSRDLKQMLDDKARTIFETEPNLIHFDEEFNIKNQSARTVKEVLNAIKNYSQYPKQDNLHNALDDAKWNKKLYEFLNTL